MRGNPRSERSLDGAKRNPGRWPRPAARERPRDINAINVLPDIGIRWQDSRQSSIADAMNPDFADAPSRLRSLVEPLGRMRMQVEFYDQLPDL